MQSSFDNDPFGVPEDKPVEIPEQVASSDETLQKQLQEKRQIEDSFSSNTKQFKVRTRIKLTYRGWSFETCVYVNSQLIDEMDYPKLAKQSGMVNDRSDVPPSAFLKQATAAHQLKYQAVKARLEERMGAAKKKNMRSLLLVLGILGVLVIVGAGGLLLYACPRTTVIEETATIGSRFNYVLPVKEGANVSLISNDTPYWLTVNDRMIQGTPPNIEHGNTYPLKFETRERRFGVVDVKRIIVLDLVVQDRYVPLKFRLVCDTNRNGKVTFDQTGVASVTLNKDDMIEVYVIDETTDQRVTQGVIHLKFNGL